MSQKISITPAGVALYLEPIAGTEATNVKVQVGEGQEKLSWSSTVFDGSISFDETQWHTLFHNDSNKLSIVPSKANTKFTGGERVGILLKSHANGGNIDAVISSDEGVTVSVGELNILNNSEPTPPNYIGINSASEVSSASATTADNSTSEIAKTEKASSGGFKLSTMDSILLAGGAALAAVYIYNKRPVIKKKLIVGRRKFASGMTRLRSAIKRATKSTKTPKQITM